MNDIINLDQLAAETAQDIVAEAGEPKKLDTLATKALGVLQEQGVYACMLYLYATGDDRLEGALRSRLLALLQRQPLTELVNRKHPQSSQWADVADFLTESVASDLNTLLLVKDLWEQTLIYVRYGAKAAKVEKGGASSNG